MVIKYNKAQLSIILYRYQLKMNSTILRRTVKLISVSALVGVGYYTLINNETAHAKLLPVQHLFNVLKAGMHMGYIYKYSNKSMTQKHQQASQHLRQALRKNGGIYIKLGQLIATLDVIVPDEYRDSMMALTRSCQVSTYQNVKKIVQQQTGKNLQQTFKQFQKQPISSASIGQVHRAKLMTGQEVAVKVQHQNLSQNVHYDLQLMWFFVKIAKYFFQDFKYQWLIQQFEVNIQKQLDFNQEAANMNRVRKMLLKQKFHNVYIPKLLHQPTKKMLIMEYIHGFHVDQIQKMRQAKINMKQIGQTFSKVIIKMIHKYGFVHADPHSGNILVRKNTKGKDELVLLDHGLYQQLSQKTKQDYNWFWLGLILNDENTSVKAANRLGTKNGLLLCSMLTSQTRQQLKSPDRNMFDLNPGTDKTVIMKHAKQWHGEIVTLLSQIKRQILLLLKVNQFARTIQNMLGGRQMGVYQDIAVCCVQNLPLSNWQKFKYKWHMFIAYLKS